MVITWTKRKFQQTNHWITRNRKTTIAGVGRQHFFVGHKLQIQVHNILYKY